MDKLPSRVFSHRKLLSFSILAARYPLTCYMQWLTKLRPKGPEKNFETGPPLSQGLDDRRPPPPPPSLTCPLRDLAIDIWASELWKFLTQQENPLVPEPNVTFLSPVTPCFDNLPVVCIHRSLRIQSSRSDSRYLCSNPVRDCYRRNWTLGTSFLRLSAFLLYAIRMNYDQTEEKKITSNKYITEWSAGFLSSSTQYYCLTFESEKYIYI